MTDDDGACHDHGARGTVLMCLCINMRDHLRPVLSKTLPRSPQDCSRRSKTKQNITKKPHPRKGNPTLLVPIPSHEVTMLSLYSAVVLAAAASALPSSVRDVTTVQNNLEAIDTSTKSLTSTINSWDSSLLGALGIQSSVTSLEVSATSSYI